MLRVHAYTKDFTCRRRLSPVLLSRTRPCLRARPSTTQSRPQSKPSRPSVASAVSWYYEQRFNIKKNNAGGRHGAELTCREGVKLDLFPSVRSKLNRTRMLQIGGPRAASAASPLGGYFPEGKAASEPGPAGRQRTGACLKTAGGEPNAQANAQHISHPRNRRPGHRGKCAPQWRG